MKSLIKIAPIFFLLIFIFSCEEPSPIEILNVEEEEVEIEVINPSLTSYVISGYDSTGISDEDLAQVSIISLSGIKNSIENITFYKGYGVAAFFDTTKPVMNDAKKLIGFKTLDVGSVKFNNQPAKVVPFVLRYRENFMNRDTLLGVKHTIEYKTVLSPDQLNFTYDKNINIELTNKEGISNQFNLRIPDEIIGKVEISGTRLHRNLNIKLSWNRSRITPSMFPGEFSEEIIVGGVTSNRDELIPLFRLRKFFSNRFEIPNSLIENVLASGKFKYIVFSFIRKIRRSNSIDRLGKIHFASQSIHNIWIKI